MKLLADNNLSPKLIKILSVEFPESKHLMDLNLENASDMDVWIYAKEKNFMIISKDTDFININAVKGFPPKVIWIQKGNCSTKEIIHLIKDNYMKIKRFNGDNEKAIFILW